jgi:hypothetical protein
MVKVLSLNHLIHFDFRHRFHTRATRPGALRYQSGPWAECHSGVAGFQKNEQILNDPFSLS